MTFHTSKHDLNVEGLQDPFKGCSSHERAY